LNFSTPSALGLEQLNKECGELARKARPTLAEYAKADDAQAVFQLVATVFSWVGLLIISYLVAPSSLILSSLLAAFGGLFWVRLFILQHDCGHGSFFSTASANRKVGTVLGVLTMTPFVRWRASHAAHHATSGNLSERSWSRDIYLMTVEEFSGSPLWMRLFYRFYRNRFVLFFVLAPLVFLVEHRRYTRDEKSLKIRTSVWGTNLALALLAALLFVNLEAVRIFQVFLPFYLVGAAVGVWLFYIQHQYFEAYWAPREQYSAAAASLYGSSVLRLPRVLGWLTAYIGIHHIHHLSPRVPSYHLYECDRAHPEFRVGVQFTLGEALIAARGDLWDPSIGRLVTFRQSQASRVH
jgi:omega-6 fatty acid desaturase (delta-12 desaturase)